MNCKRTQRLLADLARDRLPESVARTMRQHLEDCTDCRVQEQRAARLQRLLALKRYEQPAPAYFENFLVEFHRRQQADERSRARVWERIAAIWTVEPIRAWQYGFAGAMGVAVVAAGMMWAGSRTPQSLTVATNAAVSVVAKAIAAPSSPVVTPRALPEDTQPPVTLVAASDESVDSAEPNYVLDRVPVLPVTYEVASVRF